MIQVQQLTKWYGPILALDHIDLEVAPGRIVGFLGPNGAGKTTTIRILTCFMPASGGRASVNGCDVFRESHRVRRQIGYLPENTPLYPEMRVDEHLHFFGRLHGLRRSERRRRIDALTDRCGLGAIRRRPVSQLSKGNRQRVGLAQALLHDPPVLILDEPTAGLDPAQITEVRKLITSLAEQKTILLSTHILPEAEKTCEEVAIIHNGRIVADGTPEELKQRVRSGSRVILEVRAEASAVKPTLEALPDVASVEAEDHGEWCHSVVSPSDGGGDIREALGRAASERGWAIREMRHELASLEEYFVQITSAANLQAA